MTNPMFPAVSDNDDQNFPGNDKLRALLGLATGPTPDDQQMIGALAQIGATVRGTRTIARGLDALIEHMHNHCTGLREHEDKIADLIKRVAALEGAPVTANVNG